MCDNATDGNSSDDVECPTCDRDDFASEQGMKVHHKRIHGKSISGVSKECPQCGDVFRVRKSHEERRTFCSRPCMNEWQSEAFCGENAPNWQGGDVEVPCSNCGKQLTRSRGQYNRSEWSFCSVECEVAFKKQHQSGKNHPCWEGDHLLECEWCGSNFHDKSANNKKNDHHFCGLECYGKWCSANRVGENHPSWAGGWDGYYGPNWSEQRGSALRRDQYRCQWCGETDADHRQSHGSGLLVHHIQPMRWFKQNFDSPEWYEQANDLDNLITVCRGECHSTLEQMSPLCPVID